MCKFCEAVRANEDVDAGYIAANLILGRGQQWWAITVYWIVVTIKNLWEIGGENDLFTRD